MTKTIALEEHALTADVLAALHQAGGDAALALANSQEVEERLLDLAEMRLHAMDEAGCDVQVISISTPGVQTLEAKAAVPLARAANDALAAAVAAHPDR